MGVSRADSPVIDPARKSEPGHFGVSAPSRVPDVTLLAEIGLPFRQIAQIAHKAAVNNTDLADEALASGLVEEDFYYGSLAKHLGLTFIPELDPESILVSGRDLNGGSAGLAGSRMALCRDGAHRNQIVIAPRTVDRNALDGYLARYPDIESRLRITTPTALRNAFRARNRNALLDRAVNDLAKNAPDKSARIVINAWQGAAVGAFLVGMPVLAAAYPVAMSLGAHFLFSFFFLSCVYLRMAATRHGGKEKYEPLIPTAPSEFPTYTVLVPLYREAQMVPGLLNALDRIVWPRSKLEIKIICEADDTETLNALAACRNKPWIDVVEVPFALPRTKPKALNFAALSSTGQFITVYDAEDRPHPDQLLEAWQRFRNDGSDLACLQAPLIVTNLRETWLSRMFAFEYAALFRGILPWLSSKQLVMPLGGTSNHFRREALARVGWWDPYNVTEDADLGLRLSRAGYRVSTLTRPTFEEGPAQLGVWIRQRSRWYKGWLQTWLVHNRSPRRLASELGFRSFVVTQIILSGLVVSALAHPLLVFTIFSLVVTLFRNAVLTPAGVGLLAVDTANIVLGYGAFLLLGYRTLIPDERPGYWKVVLLTPLYWMTMSVAAWRALYQLARNPFHWEKTHHSVPKPPSGRHRDAQQTLTAPLLRRVRQ